MCKKTTVMVGEVFPKFIIFLLSGHVIIILIQIKMTTITISILLYITIPFDLICIDQISSTSAAADGIKTGNYQFGIQFSFDFLVQKSSLKRKDCFGFFPPPPPLS